MEQSNQLMEQRNDSLKSSSEQCQARILQAEQDKVQYYNTFFFPEASVCKAAS